MTQPNSLKKLFTGAAVAAFAAGAFAGDYGKAIIDDKMPIEDPWTWCDLFDYSTLYEAESGFIREVAFNGRYHGQYISQSEDFGNASNGFNQWQHRRARVGIDIEFAGDLAFYSSINVSDGSGSGTGLIRRDFFNDFDEVVIEWTPDDWEIVVGKQKQKITREYSTSSKRIKTVERSHIVNEVADQKPWGVTVEREFAGFTHQVGAWLYGTDGGTNRGGFQLPRGDSRAGWSYSAAIDVTDETEVHFNYVYTNNSGGAVAPRGSAPADQGSNYEHVLALGTESDFGRLGLVTDIIFGANRQASGAIPAGDDTWGFVFMPTYEITEKLEAVAKYAYMDQGQNQRTQRFNVRQRVADYHTFYAGLNYYICGDKLKIMGGYEYATGEEFGTGTDITSDTWMLAVRTYW